MSIIVRGSALALSFSLLAQPLYAQVTRDTPLEEIVVTATYRDLSLNEVAGSISIVGQQSISERAALHLENILNAVPNVTWSGGASRGRFVQIRGIGDLEQYYDPKYYPSVGLMVDDLELGDSANGGMLFDAAQVEVLRGPQGTRYGASAHAGMIKIQTNAPTDTFSGEFSGGAGNHDSYNGGLVLSGPLSESVKGRLAVQQNVSDGWIDNKATNNDDTNDLDEFGARLRLQWAPGDNALYELSSFYLDADNGHDPWSINNNRDTFTDQPGSDKQEILAFTLSGDWFFSETLSLESSLSYSDADLHQSYDADWVSAGVCEQYTCSGGYDTAQEIFDRDRERLVADLRLLGGQSNLDAGDSRWVAGLYANQGDETFDYAYPSVWYGDSFSSSDYETDRYAAYGEYEYGLSARLTLSAGVRFERFEDDYDNSNDFDSDTSENLWNGELSARYSYDDSTLLYATLSRGAKPGGVNTTATANRPFMSPVFQAYMAGKETFDEEVLLNGEVGMRVRQLDDRLSLDLSIFYTDRDNAQLENWMWDADSGLWIGYLDSNSDSTTYGAELQSSLLVNSAIEIFANLGWLITEVDQIETFDLDLNEFITLQNRDQAKSPKYQYNVGARVAFTDQLSGRLEVEGQDDAFYGYYHQGKLDSYDLINASLNWRSGPFNVSLWGRNLSDEDYAVHGLYFAVDPRDEVGAWRNETWEQLGEPRSYGIQLSYRFE